ncbi:hypothetical protein B046DRAFT_06486 [Streptomyces sp. LamerLS-316]|nr:hypothetical protein B046DRAFT_06486 [Streptomyces sp. LamerLS-316]
MTTPLRSLLIRPLRRAKAFLHALALTDHQPSGGY